MTDFRVGLGRSARLVRALPVAVLGPVFEHRRRLGRRLCAHAGNFYLVEKAGGEAFTDEDEEILVLFAAQAATAIANARTYRAERRARADLEALIETSPVGVVVFEARTGALVSLNREAARIVQDLCGPGQSAEQLLGVITCRRADGREIALDRLPLARALDRAETVRAEEVVLSVPDGRRVTTLINATPIRDPDGPDDALASVVVTLQDLAPLQDIERMRAEFLGMVSHELRAPLTSIKGSAATALRASRLVGPAEVAQFFRIIDEQADRMDSLIGDLLDAGRIDTGTLSVAPEPSDVAVLVDQARGTFISGGGRHTVRIDLPPDLPRVMADRQRLVQVLNNLLANAARHAPDSAPIRIAAEREGLSVAVSVADEGRGIAPDQLGQLFRKYTTAGDRKGGLGSGLGLAICKGLVEAQGGRIRAESGGVGLGARFHLHDPDGRGGQRQSRPGPPRPAGPRPGRSAHPRGRRRPGDAAPSPRHAGGGGLRPAGHRRPRGGGAPHPDRKAPTGPARPDAARDRRHRADADRAELADLPVIFISGYGRDETIARALEAGAEDYVVKPFSPTELTARIRAALRRRSNPVPFVLGELAIDYDRRRVSVAGRPVTLTPTEYELLRVLAQGAGRVLTHEALLRQVWAGRRRSKANPKIVRAYVKRLRHRLGDDAARPAWIVNERGVGYRMARPGEPGEP